MTVPPRPAGAARILHTSDWHLGVTVRGVSRAADHDAVLDEVVAVAEAARPHLVVHTGDLFDTARPAFDDILRALRVLRRLAAVAPTVVLAGNHDAEGMFRVLNAAEGIDDRAPFAPHQPCTQRLRFLGRPMLPTEGAVATYRSADAPTIRLACLPFVHANRVVTGLESHEEINPTYLGRIDTLIGMLARSTFEAFDPTTTVAVWASHLHVQHARLSSERQLHVSDAYVADHTHIDARYGYLAFGHIHRPQELPGGRGRYAGSPLEVDFGEEAEAKTVVVVDCAPGTYPTVTPVPLTAGRRLRRVRAPLSQLAAVASEVDGCLVEVTVVHEPGADPTAPIDDRESLAAEVRAALAASEVLGVIDARRVAVPTIDTAVGGEGAGPTGPGDLPTLFARHVAGLPAGRLADGVGAQRVVELFAELHAGLSDEHATVPAEHLRLQHLLARTAAGGA